MKLIRAADRGDEVEDVRSPESQFIAYRLRELLKDGKGQGEANPQAKHYWKQVTGEWHALKSQGLARKEAQRKADEAVLHSWAAKAGGAEVVPSPAGLQVVAAPEAEMVPSPAGPTESAPSPVVTPGKAVAPSPGMTPPVPVSGPAAHAAPAQWAPSIGCGSAAFSSGPVPVPEGARDGARGGR